MVYDHDGDTEAANPRGRALVLFSGGQDSTVCLVWALKHFSSVETIGFDYGQRHKVEMDCRADILSALPKLAASTQGLDGQLGADHVLDLATLGQISQTALTSNAAIAMQDNGLPNTFVPGRNLLFFTYAAALGYRRELYDLVGGMCETDYSGYPDCRETTLQTQAEALRLGMDAPFHIHMPLMHLDKAATWDMAQELGGEALVRLIVESTHTCYKGDRATMHEWGYGCGACPACQLRGDGFQKWKAKARAD